MAPDAESSNGVTKYFSLHEGDPAAPAVLASTGHLPARNSGKGPEPRSTRLSGQSQSEDRGRLGFAVPVHAAWIAWSLVSSAAAACWGFRLGSRPQLDAVWAEVRRVGELQAQQAQQAQHFAATVAACVTGVRNPSADKWELLRSDGGEAGAIDLGHLGPGRRWPSTSEASSQSRSWSREPVQEASGVTLPTALADAFPELVCQEGKDGAWQEVKRATSLVLGDWRAGCVRQDVQILGSVLETAVQRLQAVQGSATDCGMGRLSMSVLAVLTDDPNHSLQGARDVHAPLLTVLLEIHWGVIVWSGWPLFALLAQLQLYASGSPSRAGVAARGTRPAEAARALKEDSQGVSVSASKDTADFQARLWTAFLEQTPEKVAELGAAFPSPSPQSQSQLLSLRRMSSGHETEAPMPVLCALASQLLRPDLLSASRREVEEDLRRVQNAYRQSVQSMEDLQASMASAWPLYGILHAAAVQLNSPGSRSGF